MLWDRSNRFSPSKRDETILTYESFSDYLRQQFLQSRNLFHHYKEYRKSQKEKRHKQDTRKIHADFQSPPKVGEEITPATSMTDDLPVKDHQPENTFFLTQASEPAEDFTVRKPNYHKSKKKKSGKLILLKSKVLPSYLDKTVPGPGSYNVQQSLIKPTFNRVYTEPPPASSFNIKKKSNSIKGYLRPTSSIKKRLENKTLWNSHRESRSNILRTNSAPDTRASLDFTIISSPVSPKPSRSKAYAAAKASLTPDGRSQKRKQNQIYGKRYPPVSEKIIRRWISYSHDSYPDYSKRSLMSPKAKTIVK